MEFGDFLFDRWSPVLMTIYTAWMVSMQRSRDFGSLEGNQIKPMLCPIVVMWLISGLQVVVGLRR